MDQDTKNSIDTLALQVGVLMAAVTAIAYEFRDRPDFNARLRSAVERVPDSMLYRTVSNESIELARGTIDAILGSMPR